MVRRNVGTLDASVRVLLGFGLLGLAARFYARPFVALGLAAVAVLVLGTGLTHSCPLYVLFGLTSGDPSDHTSQARSR